MTLRGLSRRWVVATRGFAFALVASSAAQLLAGQMPGDAPDWQARALRPSGAPIVPVFEGWYQENDGSYRLCFGYWSGNTEEARSIPIGPDNLVEPREFNGTQVTHFMPAPNTGYRKRYCVFTVGVPEDFGSQTVEWSLRHRGETLTAVGRITSTAYFLDEPHSESRAAAWGRRARETGIMDEESGIPNYDLIGEDDLESWVQFNPGQAQGSIAPVLRFIEPEGPEGVGRSGIWTETVNASVGRPLTLRVWVDAPDGRPARWWVGWMQMQGPGVAVFSQHEMVADYRYANTATTTVTFDEPGEYVISVQAAENVWTFERQCCWTNGYITVSVAQ